MKKLVLALAGCLCAGVYGAVQKVIITADNANAYSAENKLVCDSTSQIVVQYSYKNAGESLKNKLLDFIEVPAPAEGEAEPWVSIRLEGDGLKNDVDFTGQPYLWLGALVDKEYALDGTFTPHGDVYRFGYAGGKSSEERGIKVSGLVDNPDTGAPRSILVRGEGVTSFRAGNACTGGMIIEGPAYVAVSAESHFGGNLTNSVTLRNVGGKPARILFRNANGTYKTTTFQIEGTNDFHSCGSSKAATRMTFGGAITGWGQINLTDQSCIYFTSPSNTFTGAVNLTPSQVKFDMEIGIGDGVNCSWKGSEIIQRNQTNCLVAVNCKEDFTLATKISATGGALIKRGAGTLTLANAFPRNGIVNDSPVMRIECGCVKRTAQEPAPAEGVMEIFAGAMLDLNGVPATSIWLPMGGGSVINPAEGAVTFKGPASRTKKFRGLVTGKAALIETAAMPWRLGAQAVLEGGLEILSGSIDVDDGFSTPDLATADNSAVRILPRGGEKVDGFKVEFWFNGSNWAGTDRPAQLDTAVALAESHIDTPDIVTNMTVFGELTSFYPQNEHFVNAVGEGKNNFVTKFSGFINIEETGLHGFRGGADDGVRIVLDNTNTVVNIADGGNMYWSTTTDIELAKGLHPITIYFLEYAGGEKVRVQIKRPNDADWRDLPLALLSGASERRSSFGAVTGGGSLELAGADLAWPQMDLMGFTGRIIANENTADISAGFVGLADSSIYFSGLTDLAPGAWWLSGLAEIVQENGKRAFQLGGEAETDNYVNRRNPLDLTKPFTVSFDFSVREPWAGTSIGDGFFLGLSDSATGTYGGTFSRLETASRINNQAAYGLQAYLTSSFAYLCWIKNNRQLAADDRLAESVLTNDVYLISNAKDRANPFHVTMSWDLEKMITTFERTGQATLALTNNVAYADLQEKYPSGKAYLGLWARNGGLYCTMLFENFLVREGEGTETKAVTLNGELGITNGLVQVTGGTGAQATIASALQVRGNGTLKAFDGFPAALNSADWTFDLRVPDAKLTLDGAFSFPQNQTIGITLEGLPDGKKRVIADLTGVGKGAADELKFRLDSALPPKYTLVYDNGLLKVVAISGTVIYLK